MDEQLPNILIDGIPFILEPKWLRQWDSTNVLFKCDMKDEGHFFWFMFDQKSRQIVTGMQQFELSNKHMVRVILPADLFNRIDYHREFHHGGFQRQGEAKKHNYQLLPDITSRQLIKTLRELGVTGDDQQLGETAWQVIEQMPAAFKERKKWTPGQRKRKLR